MVGRYDYWDNQHRKFLRAISTMKTAWCGLLLNRCTALCGLLWKPLNRCNWGNQDRKCKGHFNHESTAWLWDTMETSEQMQLRQPRQGWNDHYLLQCTVFRITVCQSRLYKRNNRSRFSHNINATVAAVQALPKKTASLHRSLVSLTYKRIKRTDHGRSSEGKFQ